MNNILSDINTHNALSPTLASIFKSIYQKTISFLENSSNQFPPFLLRLILAYEFWEAGIMKFEGNNWFGHITFPLPFNLLPNDML